MIARRARLRRSARPRRPAAAAADRARSAQAFPGQGQPAASRCRRSTACRSPCARARRWASSASRAAASRPWPGCCCIWSCPMPASWCSTASRSARRTGIAVDALRRQVQMVFQDSYSSLNPRMPIRDSVAFGPFVQGKKKRDGARHRPRHAAQGRARPGPVRPALSARAVRRPEAAGQHRPRARHRAAHGDPRRAGLGARQIGRGAGAEPAARAEAAVQPDLCLHQPRSRTSSATSATGSW